MHKLYCIPHSCVSHTHKQLSAVTSGEQPYTITGKEDEYPADESTLQRTVHAVEKLSREVPITVWAIQGAQARHHSPPYCIHCDLPTYQMYVSVPAWYTGHMTSSSYVQNYKSFAEFIVTQVLVEDDILMSFNMASLVTCIPTGLAVLVAHQRLEMASPS